MSNYRRIYQERSSFFFTVVTYQRKPIFASPENVSKLRTSFRKIKNKYPIEIEAIVILPDHIHCIWKMPEDDADHSRRWRAIKQDFSKQIETPINHRGEKLIWQRRYWEHLIRDEYDWRLHMDYIHYNPVKHGYVESPKDWPYSSFHNMVKKDYYSHDWGAHVPSAVLDMEHE